MSPRRQLRWGVLGAAEIGRKAVIPAILAAGGELRGLASRDPERGRGLAATFQIPQLWSGYQQLLESDLDAVYIPLPNSLHLPWTLQALAAGKHVLCEKPLALTSIEAGQMRKAADQAGLVLAEAVMYRYHPRWKVVRGLIDDGAVGELRHLQGSFTFPLGPPPNIRWQQELGGGALYDIGSYLVSACRWLAGEPSRVLARTGRRHGVDADGAMLLEFPGPGGAISAELAYSFEAAEHQQLTVLGSEGSLQVPTPFTAWTGQSIPLRLVRGSEGSAEVVPTPAADPYRAMVEAFAARVAGGPALLAPALDSERGLTVLDAARESLSTGAWAVPQGRLSP